MNTAKTVLFCGTPDFAVPSLNALIASDDFDVQLVISQPDKPVGRKQEVLPTAVKVAAGAAGITVIQPEDINAEGLPLPDADFLVTVAYGQIMKQKLLDHPNVATINIHGSLLPKWRGASPMQHSLLHGDTHTGVTIQQMVEKLDAGPILSQSELSLDGTETIQQLHDSLAELSASLLLDTLSNPLEPKEQNESEATFCTKLSRKDGEVDPKTMTAEEIDRHVRALVPWPGVTCTLQGETVKLLATSVIALKDAVPLPCKDGTTLYITTLQSPGKRPLEAKVWLRGQLNKE